MQRTTLLIKVKLKAIFASIVKEENLYLKDFINHYKSLECNNFYIYVNNDINDERWEDVMYD